MNTEDLHRNMIAFGEWILQSMYRHGFDGDTHFWWYRETAYTTEELFNIYLTELNGNTKAKDTAE